MINVDAITGDERNHSHCDMGDKNQQTPLAQCWAVLHQYGALARLRVPIPFTALSSSLRRHQSFFSVWQRCVSRSATDGIL